MFIETWRKHWGLIQDPFSCEDADKDLILERMHAEAVHSVFERLFGDASTPAPGIVFGEKGSGKSGLRLTMRRKLDALGAEGPRVLCTEYMDFDAFLENFRRAVGVGADPEDLGRAVCAHWRLADHLDAMLSGGVTELVDRLLDGEVGTKALSRKQKADLLLLTAFYYDSRARTTAEALHQLRARLHVGFVRGAGTMLLRLILSLVALCLVLLPYLGTRVGLPAPGAPLPWVIGGALLLALVWGEALVRKARLARGARSVKDIRILARNPSLVTQTLRSLDPNVRKEFTLPQGRDEATRYDHLRRFGSLMKTLGFESWYVLFDRIDEPSALSAYPDGAERFVETILDHKLLQVPGLALKLFLPIELDGIYRNASPERLKRMRLDKSNLVPMLNWTGQELIEIAGQRIRACREDGAEPIGLDEFLAEDLELDYVRDTLQTLGTPRYALGFLTTLFLEYARNLPGDLDEDAEEWRVPRRHFDVIRASWIDQANLMRRKLN
jgi:hypothetical protein